MANTVTRSSIPSLTDVSCTCRRSSKGGLKNSESDRGELFTLTKAEKKNGTRRTIEWVVAAGERGDRQPQERVQPPSGQRPPQQPNGTVVPRNANGHRANSTNDTKGFLVTSHGQLLLQSMAAAVDVAGATERYAAASGVELQFTSEDLREIGLRIYAAGLK